MPPSYLLLALCLFLVVQAGQAWRAPKDNTTFYVPATGASGYCETYDLSKLAAIGGINFTNLDGFHYALGVCADLDKSKVPLVCQSKDPAPAYQFSASACYALGKIDSVLVVCPGFLQCHMYTLTLYMEKVQYSYCGFQ